MKSIKGRITKVNTSNFPISFKACRNYVFIVKGNIFNFFSMMNVQKLDSSVFVDTRKKLAERIRK
jgi:hypothetical protein